MQGPKQTRKWNAEAVRETQRQQQQQLKLNCPHEAETGGIKTDACKDTNDSLLVPPKQNELKMQDTTNTKQSQTQQQKKQQREVKAGTGDFLGGNLQSLSPPALLSVLNRGRRQPASFQASDVPMVKSFLAGIDDVANAAPGGLVCARPVHKAGGAADDVEACPGAKAALRFAILAEWGAPVDGELGTEEHLVVAECPPIFFAGDLSGVRADLRAWRRRRRALALPRTPAHVPPTHVGQRSPSMRHRPMGNRRFVGNVAGSGVPIKVGGVALNAGTV